MSNAWGWAWGAGYLGTPGRVVRISPWVRVKGPASHQFRPAGQTGRLGGADIRPGEGAFVSGGLLGPSWALPGGLGPLLWPHPPPVTTAGTRLTVSGDPASAAGLVWARSGRGGLLLWHPVLLAGTGRGWRAVSPQGVGACHRHVLKFIQQQREGPILGTFAAPHDGLGSRAKAEWGPGREGTQKVHPTQTGQHSIHRDETETQ